MSNPKDRGNPDTCKSEPEWYNTDYNDGGNNNWGVHSNSGVQNYMCDEKNQSLGTKVEVSLIIQP